MSTRLDEPDALDALHEDPQRPVGHLDHLVYDGDRADAVEVVHRRVGLFVLDGEQREHPLARDDVVDQRTERSCPTASGVIDSGKTTVSFSGRTGSVRRSLAGSLMPSRARR